MSIATEKIFWFIDLVSPFVLSLTTNDNNYLKSTYLNLSNLENEIIVYDIYENHTHSIHIDIKFLPIRSFN